MSAVQLCLEATRSVIGYPRSILAISEESCCKITPFPDPLYGTPECRAALDRCTTELCAYLLLDDLVCRHGREIFPCFLTLLGAAKNLPSPPLRSLPEAVRRHLPEPIQRGLAFQGSFCLHLEYMEGSRDLGGFLQDHATRQLTQFELAEEAAIYLVLLTLHNLEWAAERDGKPTLYHNDLHLKNILVTCPTSPPPSETSRTVRLGNQTRQILVPSDLFRVAVIDFNLSSTSSGFLTFSELSSLNRIYGIGRTTRQARSFFDVHFFLNSLYILLRNLAAHLVHLTNFERRLMAWIKEHIPKKYLGRGFRFSDSPEQIDGHGEHYHQRRQPTCKVARMDDSLLDDPEAQHHLVESRLSTFGSYVGPMRDGHLPSRILPLVKEGKASALMSYCNPAAAKPPIFAEQVISGEFDFTPAKLDLPFPTPAALIESLLNSHVFSGSLPSSSRTNKGASSTPVPYFDLANSFSPVSPASPPTTTTTTTTTRNPEDEEIVSFDSDED